MGLVFIGWQNFLFMATATLIVLAILLIARPREKAHGICGEHARILMFQEIGNVAQSSMESE